MTQKEIKDCFKHVFLDFFLELQEKCLENPDVAASIGQIMETYRARGFKLLREIREKYGSQWILEFNKMIIPRWIIL